MTKPVKRIAFADTGVKPKLPMRIISAFLEDRYDFEITSSYDADYVFHTCRGYDVLKYSGIRIYVTEENVSPNFNISDYALAFDQMSFGDRYCRLPWYKVYPEADRALCTPRPDPTAVLAKKTGFCAYVMSNTSNSAPERTAVFDKLNTYKTVHSGGRWNNNAGGPVEDKIAFQEAHKFVIACENSSYPGYLTEKFAEAAQSNAVPIYWGDPTVAAQLNPASFINCHQYDSRDAMLEDVKRLDQDDEAYCNMLSEPWYPDGVEPEILSTAYIRSFLNHIFDQPHASAYRRNRGRWGIKTERRMYNMAFRPLTNMGDLARKKWRRLWHAVFG